MNSTPESAASRSPRARARIPFRIGQGIDFHVFEPGRRLVLGGVEIPHSHGLKGHSDADALLHAVCDALLGAAGLPDIGHWFPDTDAKWKDIDSRVLLREVRARVEAAGYLIGNVDVTVVAQTPRLSPHIPLMRERIADDLHVEPDQVAIGATTPERMGAIGRSEGIAALAVALIVRADSLL